MTARHYAQLECGFVCPEERIASVGLLNYRNALCQPIDVGTRQLDA